MTILIRPNGRTPKLDRPELVSVLSVLDETEFRAIVDEARGPELVPLAELLVEGIVPDATTVDRLATKLGDAVLVDDIGRRGVTRDTARALFTEHAARVDRARERRESNRAGSNPYRDRAKAIAAKGPDGFVIEPPVWRS